MTKLEIILEHYPDSELLKADGFDDAIIGVANNKTTGEEVLVYSISKAIAILRRDMSIEEATEHFYFNVEGAYVGKKTPIWIDDEMFEE